MSLLALCGGGSSSQSKQAKQTTAQAGKDLHLINFETRRMTAGEQKVIFLNENHANKNNKRAVGQKEKPEGPHV